jgi:glycosyltransferase involved in cell wall biosynthesis
MANNRTTDRADWLLSIVVPAFNEQEVLPEFHRRASAVAAGLDVRTEFVYINDGSQDATLDVLYDLRRTDPRVAIVDLSRNFGKEIALTAGLDKTNGDAVVVLDADLQDPPELIPELVRVWQSGFDVVYAQRQSRDGESALKKLSAHLFYRVMGQIGKVKIPPDTGDFRLLSRRAVAALRELREHHRYMKGLFAWIGFPQKAVLYRRDARFAGTTKWNYWRLWTLAVEGFTSFTTAPLKIATYIGLLTALGAFSYGAFIIYKTLVYGDPVTGYPSLMVVILFLGGIQLIGIGVIGEYLGRMFNETKGRPLYLLKGYESPNTDFRPSELGAVEPVSRSEAARAPIATTIPRNA